MWVDPAASKCKRMAWVRPFIIPQVRKASAPKSLQFLLHWGSEQKGGDGHTEILTVKPCICYDKWAHQDGRWDTGHEQARMDVRSQDSETRLAFTPP